MAKKKGKHEPAITVRCKPLLYFLIPGFVGLIIKYYNSPQPDHEQSDNIEIYSPFFPNVFTVDYKAPTSAYTTTGTIQLSKVNYRNIIGSSTFLQCFKEKTLSLFQGSECYNCLGWASWKKEWVQMPSIIYADEKEIISEVRSFLKLQAKDLKPKAFALGEANFPSFKQVDCEDPSNNMIAFYFECYMPENKQCLWKHAARYLGDVVIADDTRSADTWTSKFGAYQLISHDKISDLAIVYGMTTVCFAPEILT